MNQISFDNFERGFQRGAYDGNGAVGTTLPTPSTGPWNFYSFPLDGADSRGQFMYSSIEYPYHHRRCYHQLNTLFACRSRAYEESQCRPAMDDYEECMYMGKHKAYLQRKAVYRAHIPWEEHRRVMELSEAAWDRHQSDPRPLPDRVREAKGRFDTATGRFDQIRLAASFWGAGGTYLAPRSYWDEAQPTTDDLQTKTPGWAMNYFKARFPHPMMDVRSFWDRLVSGDSARNQTWPQRDRLGWHPETQAATATVSA